MYLSKRNSIYYIFYRQPNGKLTCKSTKEKSKAAALEFLSSFKDLIKDRLKNKVTEITLKDFRFQFLKNIEPTHSDKTMKAYKVTFKFFSEYMGNIKLTDITLNKMRSYFEHRIKSGSIFQARKDLINLNCAFNWAINAGFLVLNPCKDIKRFKLPEKQPLYFTAEAFENLISKIEDKDIKDLVIFAVNTGLRQMELLTLKWRQINIEDRLLILDNREHLTKGKKVRAIPINKKALLILQDRQKNNEGRTETVFTYYGEEISQNFISKIFKKYVLAADVNLKLNFHSLRHTFATWLIQKGAPIYEVSKLLGHADIKTTEIYAHVNPEDLRKSTDLLD